MHGLVTGLVALRTTSPTMEDYDTRYYAVNTRGRGRSRNDTSISMADLFEAIIFFVLLALLVLIWVACTFVIFVTSVAYMILVLLMSPIIALYDSSLPNNIIAAVALIGFGVPVCALGSPGSWKALVSINAVRL
jgi:hypothetical protein